MCSRLTSQIQHTKWSECQLLPMAEIITPVIGSSQLAQTNLLPPAELLRRGGFEGEMGLSTTGGAGFSCSTRISFEASSARGIPANLSSSVMMHLLSCSRSICPCSLFTGVSGVLERDWGVSSRIGGSSLLTLTSGVMGVGNEFELPVSEYISKDLVDTGVPDLESVPLAPFAIEVLSELSTAFRAVHGFAVTDEEVSIRLNTDVELLGETEFGRDTALLSLTVAAMALKMAEFARTVPGAGTPVRLGESARAA